MLSLVFCSTLFCLVSATSSPTTVNLTETTARVDVNETVPVQVAQNASEILPDSAPKWWGAAAVLNNPTDSQIPPNILRHLRLNKTNGDSNLESATPISPDSSLWLHGSQLHRIDKNRFVPLVGEGSGDGFLSERPVSMKKPSRQDDINKEDYDSYQDNDEDYPSTESRTVKGDHSNHSENYGDHTRYDKSDEEYYEAVPLSRSSEEYADSEFDNRAPVDSKNDIGAVSPEKHSNMVVIKRNHVDKDILCLGALITYTHFLSSATCVTINKNLIRQGDVVPAADHPNQCRKFAGCPSRKVRTAFISRNYHNGHSDVSIVVLRKPFCMTKELRPASLTSNQIRIGDPVKLVEVNDVLRIVELEATECDVNQIQQRRERKEVCIPAVPLSVGSPIFNQAGEIAGLASYEVVNSSSKFIITDTALLRPAIRDIINLNPPLEARKDCYGRFLNEY